MLKLGSQWIGALRAKLKKWRPAVILKTRGEFKRKGGNQDEKDNNFCYADFSFQLWIYGA
jgi:hypothetical protein